MRRLDAIDADGGLDLDDDGELKHKGGRRRVQAQESK
jgi:hypothetical protein